MKIFECAICKKQVYLVHETSVPTICCGEPMTELTANTTDAATEKHVPFVTVDGNTINVVIGETVHPMTPEHYIEWIAVEQGAKVQFAKLTPADEPKASFVVDTAKPYTVYEFCNLHRLWKIEK
jgi:superoxide reductase